MANQGHHHPRTAGADAGTLENNNRFKDFKVDFPGPFVLRVLRFNLGHAHPQKYIIKVDM